ncbi:MAG: hypothetical protein LBJ31_06610 [Treponema sp.]|jgi:esterase/lipase|nr:hypothetical protein [Treponema sp.]
MKRKSIAAFIIFTLAFSCKTIEVVNRKNPYPNMETVHYGNSAAYVFKNDASGKLLIVIEGSGWESVLGIQTEDGWHNIGCGGLLLPVLGGNYSIMIPEKLKRQPGQNYMADMEDRANYTAGNLIDCYVESINGYLAEHSFSSVVIAGFSEGACLLPLVYERINDKAGVKALVSMGFGGFSWYESVYMLSLRQDFPAEYIKMNQYFVEMYKPGKDSYPDSYKEHVYAISYRWFNSIKDIKPFEYYKNITIPVLFIHGDNDYNIPVESTRYIQENLPEKPFTYKYFPWDHQPREDRDFIQWRKEIAEWIISIDE